MDIKKVVLSSVVPGYGTAQLLNQIIKSSTDNQQKNDTDLNILEEEVLRQQMYEKINEAKARVAQEVAIAERIQNAETVEIEEFYDLSGKGSLGLTLEETLNLGLKASGQKVSRRVYKFNGKILNDLSFGEESVSDTDEI
ncbi:hypothetical protein [Macrococcoides canis]|uniref:hypothetical protein n=1 Tax=Macrococcoides canis TaxID=1855823 RepID=UPI00165E1966|nr:hypothetical protein [Macrococcus canis]QNR07144.1 hypothetical protein GL258_02395 [Macrococcus canis]